MQSKFLPLLKASGACNNTPLGCDTFVAYPPSSPDGKVVFGKNSDRPAGESQSIRRYPSAEYAQGAMVQCTYLKIPQVSKTFAVLLSQIDWMWGAENGANECGVVIGNEAVWTKVPEEKEKLLLGMDLVRLGLERGSSSKEALDVIVNLLEKHGQGGPCAWNDWSFTYHNSFLIADSQEAWVLETCGRHWVAERISQGARHISNGLTIRTKFDLCSEGLLEYARKQGFWNDQEQPFDFAKCVSVDGVVDDDDDDDDCSSSRQGCGRALLKEHENQYTFDRQAMMKILCDHDSGICMHGSFETTASMVTEWDKDGTVVRHWMTGKPYPCQSEFIIQSIEQEEEEKSF